MSRYKSGRSRSVRVLGIRFPKLLFWGGVLIGGFFLFKTQIMGLFDKLKGSFSSSNTPSA